MIRQTRDFYLFDENSWQTNKEAKSDLPKFRPTMHFYSVEMWNNSKYMSSMLYFTDTSGKGWRWNIS